jgi:hypothetical protein
MSSTHRAAHPRFRVALVMLGLLLVMVWFYAPTLGFGFIWDDPLWYSRVAAKSLVELVKPTTDYHFYRPGVMLYHRLFMEQNGTFAVPLLHAAHIGWHLLNIALAYALSRRLGLESWAAVVVAGLTAFYPFSYQAVAWTAAQQPMAVVLQNGAWLAYLEARPGRLHRRLAAALSLLLFLIALTVQEGTVAVAVVPLLMELVLWRRTTTAHSVIPPGAPPSQRGGHGVSEAKNPVQARQRPFALLRVTNGAELLHWKLALVYPLLGLGFGLLWLRLPRLPGYTTLAFEGQTVLYLLQGFVFPVLGRPAGYEPGQIIAMGTLVALTGLTLAWLLIAAWRGERARLALVGLTWALLGIAPAVVGLRYESFVSLSPRLLHYCGPGVALLWVCALLPPGRPGAAGSSRRVWQMIGVTLIGLIVLQSSLLLSGFQRMYAVGTRHLGELIQVARAGEDHLVFVNFPDRYTPRRPPYPMGYWDMTLAPVVVDLGDFPAVVIGKRPHTVSLSLPWIDAETRDAGPYQVDLRGVITPPDQLYQLAHQADAVYLSRYSSDGTFALRRAGTVTSEASASPSASACRAIFEQRLCLQSAEVDRRPGRLGISLTWLSLAAAQPNDTVFVHLGQVGRPPIAQADGDLWLGMLPLFILQPGDTIREQRGIQLPQAMPPGQFVLRVGVYNRITGERLPATTPQGEPLPDNALVIGHLPEETKMP